MAFCNNQAGCGHSCGRSDDHGGGCDCYEGDCKHSSRYKPPPVPPVPKPVATFYAVRSGGQYYHSYSRAGSTGWVDKVDKVEDASVWTRRGPAQGMVTRLSALPEPPRTGPAPRLPVPELVEFVVTEVRVIDQASRVAEAQAKKERELAAQKKACHEREVDKARGELARAAERLKKLQEEG